MKKFKQLLSVLLCVITCGSLFGCASGSADAEVNPKDFRVTAYVVCNEDVDINSFDVTHAKQITDFIIFGCATFDEQGNLNMGKQTQQWVDKLRSVCNPDARIHLNVLGPGSQTTSSDWNEQMADLSQRHTNAFKSGVLEENIKSALEQYKFDGVFFDYEYPLEKKPWKAFNKFIVSLNKCLGDDYKIGMALAAWNLGQNARARGATDFITLMSYDLWDENGNHATLEIAKNNILSAREAGYDMSKVDLGLPFYARPTDHGAYWYDYKGYYDNLDENGLFVDEGNTGLTFSFNTADVIKEKTDLAIEEGMGGVMIWHYACDVPADNDQSLFNAISEAKQSAIDANADNQ